MKRFFLIMMLVSCPLWAADDDYAAMRDRIVQKYSGEKPSAFGMYISGVKTRIRTDKKIIALTFDACGGTGGRLFDRELIRYLSDNRIPATLFVTTSWIKMNESVFEELKNNPVFDLQNHGYNHRPASVSGAAAWKIPGTKNAGECFDEFEMSAREFQKRTGRRPVLYRSGTAFFDDVAVKILADTGQVPMNFSGVTGDADRSLSLAKVEKFIRQNIRPGAVMIMHFNHPEGKTLAALKDMIPEIKSQGYTFVKLVDYKDSLE
ncbi:MAG: polysaccharide deacetylase family protein [Spirochaetota bacterium]